MKKLYLLGLCSVFGGFLHSQSLSPSVIASTGGFASNANGSLSYTVGEMSMVETFSAGGSILTQGFQQPTDNVVGLLDITQEEFGSFAVYPNPAVDNLSFGFMFPENGKTTVVLYNELGQKISDVLSTTYAGGKTVEQLNVSGYAAGVYFLTLNFVGEKDGKAHTISKKFQVIN